LDFEADRPTRSVRAVSNRVLMRRPAATCRSSARGAAVPGL